MKNPLEELRDMFSPEQVAASEAARLNAIDAAFAKRLKAAEKAAKVTIESIKLGPSRAERHRGIDMIALRKRRAKNRVARRQRRINRKQAVR